MLPPHIAARDPTSNELDLQADAEFMRWPLPRQTAALHLLQVWLCLRSYPPLALLTHQSPLAHISPTLGLAYLLTPAYWFVALGLTDLTYLRLGSGFQFSEVPTSANLRALQLSDDVCGALGLALAAGHEGGPSRLEVRSTAASLRHSAHALGTILRATCPFRV